MAISLVLTVIGADKPGLVEVLSRTLAAHQANWLESRMSRLASRFAGILLASVPAGNLDALKTALAALEGEGLRIVIEESGADTALREYRTVKLELIGADRAGIVHEISEALARQGVSIDDLVTEVLSASWSGEKLFQAAAELRVPREVATADLRAVLEDLANELMVDIALDEFTG